MRKYKKVFIGVYARLLILGFALTGLTYTFFPNLILCTSLFGNECDPVGNYIVAFASLPGYLVASILLFYFRNVSAQLLIVMIVSFSFLFYFLLGLFLDAYKKRKTNLSKTQLLIIISFFVLLIALVLIV